MAMGVGLGVCLVLTGSSSLWAGGAADPKVLLDKAIKAMGGAAKLDKLQSVSWKGTMEVDDNGQKFNVKHEGAMQTGDKIRVELEVDHNGKKDITILVIHGDQGWASNRGKVKEAPEKDLAAVKYVFYSLRLPHLLTTLKDKAFKLSPLDETKIGNRAAVGIKVEQAGRADVNLYFDKENHLPLKTEVRVDDGRREQTFEFRFGDYKDFDGLKHYTKLTLKAEGKEFITDLTEVRPGARLEPRLFTKP
jgi:hypothetical protein